MIKVLVAKGEYEFNRILEVRLNQGWKVIQPIVLTNDGQFWTVIQGDPIFLDKE